MRPVCYSARRLPRRFRLLRGERRPVFALRRRRDVHARPPPHAWIATAQHRLPPVALLAIHDAHGQAVARAVAKREAASAAWREVGQKELY